MQYHAYRIFKPGEGVGTMKVDVDAAALLRRLAEDLKAAADGVTSIEVGNIEANSPREAIDQIRQGFWLDEGYGFAEGRTLCHTGQQAM